MKKNNDVDKYLKVKKISGIRMRTKLGEEAGERILRPRISSDIVFEQYHYMKMTDSFHACDFIYKKEDIANEEESKNINPSKKPLIIYVHGGGWTVGSKEARRGMLSLLAEQGFFIVSMNYTLCPEAEKYQQVKEIFACTEYALSRAGEYGIDESGVFMCGDSAGGHLVAFASVCKNNKELASEIGYTFQRDFKIKGIAPICGVFDFRTVLSCKFWFMKKYIWAYSDGRVKEFLRGERSFLESPINFVGDFPPCYIVMGQADKLKKQSEELIIELAKVGADFKLFIGEGKGGFHVFPVMFTTKLSKKCIQGISDFFFSKM